MGTVCVLTVWVCVWVWAGVYLQLQLVLLSAPSALTTSSNSPEEVTQLFTTLAETDVCAEYWVIWHNQSSLPPALFLSIYPTSCGRWMCSDLSCLLIQFRISQPFCKQLRAHSQLIGAWPGIDLGHLDFWRSFWFHCLSPPLPYLCHNTLWTWVWYLPTRL